MVSKLNFIMKNSLAHGCQLVKGIVDKKVNSIFCVLQKKGYEKHKAFPHRTPEFGDDFAFESKQ